MKVQGRKLLKNNEVTLFLVIVILFVLFSLLSPYFFRTSNLLQLLTQFVELGFLTIGTSAAILSGGFDISIGTLTSMLTVVLAILIGSLGLPIWLALILALSLAVICGLLNGWLCGYLKLAPMLATLGTMSFFSGVGMVLSRGNTVPSLVPEFYVFGQGKLFGVIPVQIILFLIVAVIAVVLFNYSRWGRRIYLIGTDAQAARFAGVNCERNTLLVYVLSALMAFCCAVILTSRMNSGRADVGDPLVLQSVSAAVFGGISIKGGSGNILGALMGVVIFSLISNGMNLLDISVFIQQITQGLLLLGVLTTRILVERQ